MNQRRASLAFALLAAPLVACLPEVRPYCAVDTDCGAPAACREGRCVVQPEPPDASVDATDGPNEPFVRDVCLVGTAMPEARDACVDSVCAHNEDCCKLGWDETCVQRAAATCTLPSGAAGGRCPSDVAVAGFGMDVLRVRLVPPGHYPVHSEDVGSQFVSSSAWADADGDGDVDLAMGINGGLKVLEGNGVTAIGALSFVSTPVVTISEPGAYGPNADMWGSRVAWADADSDDDLDLLWHDQQLGLHVFRREPGPPVRYVQETLIPAAVSADVQVSAAWMQLDRDDDLELVATRGGRFRLFDRPPMASWRELEGPVVSDGGFVATFHRLITVRGQIMNAGIESLSAIGTPLPIDGARGMAFGDINRDDHLDVVVGLNEELRYFPSAGATTFLPVERLAVQADEANPINVFGVAIADLDGNGTLDVFGSARDKASVVRLRRPDGTFEAPVLTAVTGKYSAQAVSLTGVK